VLSLGVEAGNHVFQIEHHECSPALSVSEADEVPAEPLIGLADQFAVEPPFSSARPVARHSKHGAAHKPSTEWRIHWRLMKATDQG